MAPPSMVSMPIIGITAQVPRGAGSLSMNFGQDPKLSSTANTPTVSPNAGAEAPGATNPSQALVKKIFTHDEISRHRQEDDAWIVVDGKVYDVTYFLETHPGGPELILDHLSENRDAGNLMRGKETEDGHSHSKAAFRMLEQFHIGSVDSPESKSAEVVQKSTEEKAKYTVDLTKPIVSQVGALGADYDDWVHDPIISRESPRFFESDIAEASGHGCVVPGGGERNAQFSSGRDVVPIFFTRTKWWVIPLVWCPVSFIMLNLSVRNGVTPQELPLLVILGGFGWSFVEYLLHRFLFHMKTSSYWGNTIHYVLHGFHHKHPMDGARLVFPPAFTSVICVMIWIVLGSWLAPYPYKLAIYGGALLAYVAYDLTHYFLHFGVAFNDQSRKMKRYHLNHHFKDQTNGYGITSTTWDWVFQTLPAAKLAED